MYAEAGLSESEAQHNDFVELRSRSTQPTLFYSFTDR